jgi:hypothetical protein
MTAPKHWKDVMAHLDASDGNLTADVETVITSLMPHMSTLQWIIGDAIIRLGGTKNTKTMDYFRKLASKQNSTLYSWVQTCETFPPNVRWQILNDTATPDGTYSLDFNHFRHLNKVVKEHGLDIALEALKVVADESYTIEQLGRYIIIEIEGNEPSAPKPKKVSEVQARYDVPIRNGIFYIDGHNPDFEVGKEYILKVYEVIED